jgi:predicted AAA+ superfamily ATPase
MLNRSAQKTVQDLLRLFPVVAIVGPRQCGKTTLARTLMEHSPEKFVYLDLELQRDLAKLSDQEAYLSHHESETVILDEVQRMPELFPSLRALVDQKRVPARFLILGSASPDLLRQSAESLAGRIAYLELTPFLLPEVRDVYSPEDLWLKGGFPGSLESGNSWQIWMQNFVMTYLERDLPQLGFSGNSVAARRLWTMLAHNHANLVNFSELGRSLELSHNTIKSYLDFMEKAFLIRQLHPYTVNLGKRVVKTPKVYIRDSGIFHFLLGIEHLDDLFGNLKLGASWEGFVIEQIIGSLPPNRSFYFYRTREGSELDLVIAKAGQPLAGIEIKYGSDIRPSKGNTLAANAMNLKHRYVVTRDSEDFILRNGFRVCSLERFLYQYLPEL